MPPHGPRGGHVDLLSLLLALVVAALQILAQELEETKRDQISGC